MTTFEVIGTGHNETENGEVYTLKLKGESGDVKFALTLKSEFKSSIEQLIPFIVGERRDINIIDPNRKLSEFGATTPEHSENVEKMSTLAKELGAKEIKLSEDDL